MKISNYSDVYDQKALEKDSTINFNRPYQQCSLSVMDTIADPDISFDKNGVCNYYHEYKKAEETHCLIGEKGRKKQEHVAETMIKSAKNQKYNCLLGLSGGADSTYLAYLAKDLGLNPLLVNFDYGWNTEIATKNIENAVKATGFDLYTVVMNWQEFKHLQRSYFKASVLDLDVPADHMIFGALYKTANKYKIKHVLSGNNIWTEHTLPKSWNYNKFDLVNLKNIHAKFDNTPLKELPALGVWQYAYYQLLKNIKGVTLLDYQEFVRTDILKVIESEMGWINYGGKHQESVFTRFYQGYILPKKFKIDKRKAHLSNLIFSGQCTKEEALKELNEPAYDLHVMEEDFEFMAKKLDFSLDEFEAILTQKNVNHQAYGTDSAQRARYFKIMSTLKPITRIVKKLRP